MIRVCFVCLGNICRSPQAEGIFAHLVEKAGLSQHFFIDSAGTGDWHVGELPDPRTRAASQARGVPLTTRARHFQASDFAKFDHILVMDRNNLRDVLALAPSPEARAKVRLLRDLDPQGPGDVPDPYYGGANGFGDVFDMCERACARLLAELSLEI